jgi:hypothetical protein
VSPQAFTVATEPHDLSKGTLLKRSQFGISENELINPCITNKAAKCISHFGNTNRHVFCPE